MKLLKETEDPDLRKSIYGLFASISTVMKKEIAMALPQIVEYAINSIQSSEGIVVSIRRMHKKCLSLSFSIEYFSQPHFKEDETTAFPIYEDLSDENDDEEDIENTDNEEDGDDDDVAGYSVENAYIEEKEEAIMALKEIAQYTE